MLVLIITILAVRRGNFHHFGAIIIITATYIIDINTSDHAVDCICSTLIYVKCELSYRVI